MQRIYKRGKFYGYWKRGADVVISFIGMILLMPFLLIICLILYLDSPGPVLYKQERYGKDRKVFVIYKLRTMQIDAPLVAANAREDPKQYLTRAGAFFRRYSIDELPQLVNILKGDMSLVGPRPVILAEEDLIREREKYDANSVRPGLTGWAQVNGRNEIDNVQKAYLDGEYVKNFGFWMDLRILLATVGVVGRGEGIYQVEKKRKNRRMPFAVTLEGQQEEENGYNINENKKT